MTRRDLLESIAADVRAMAQAAKEARSPLMTCEQMAELLQVTTRTLRRMELMDEIPRCIHVGGLKRWRRGEVEKWLAGKRK
ncbi:MAG: helix-turn-helix domain-containing protein [Planctomycetes bacterium]|nr:helix-turn-helix domain-containing protein [Planctomycetota bacterium]